jgi:Dolichyl-phosphate-mannose-protein mannosyltransferase
MTSLGLPDLTDIREGLSLPRQVRIVAGEWVRRHAASACLLVPLLVLIGAVHAIGMWSFPRWVDDPGTYLSQAWSLQYQRALSPYSYIYDHAPAGWIQLSLWSMLTDGFNRYDSAIGFGSECMLLAKLASCALLFALARRLQFSRWGAAGTVLVLGLCPLELMYSRWTFLDNLVTPWLLLAFVLAASPRRSISAATGAALSFAMAALTKETALVALPALVWAMAQNLDRRNRAQVITVAGFSGLLLMAMYPLYALYKGELFERPDQNSLLGTAKWQLMERESSGSLLDPISPTTHMVGQWLVMDRWLLLAGLVAIPTALLARRLRPAVLVLVIQWLVLVRGGYVPFMHVVNLMPWSALIVVGAVEILSGNRRLATFRPLASLGRSGQPVARPRAVATGLAAIGLAAVVLAGSWIPTLRPMLQARQEPPLWSATQWLADNVPRDRVLVVHDSIWTDLVHHYGFDPQPIIVYKLDTDPAVREQLRRIDYLVLPNWYYATPAGVAKYPTVTEARKHAVAVARFGSGDDGVQVYRVSRYWRPR